MIRIENKQKQLEETELHLLPFKLRYDGKGNCEEYFYKEIQNKKEDKKEMSFQGRRLKG